LTVTDDTKDLDEFNNKLVSASVEGNCCWTVFTKDGFEGGSEQFKEGKYTSVVSVGKVFRGGVSVRKDNSC